MSGEAKWNDQNVTPEALKILSKLKTYKEEWISNPITPEEERKNYTVVFKAIKDYGLKDATLDKRMDTTLKFAELGVDMKPEWFTDLFSGESKGDIRAFIDNLPAETKVRYGDSLADMYETGDLSKRVFSQPTTPIVKAEEPSVEAEAGRKDIITVRGDKKSRRYWESFVSERKDDGHLDKDMLEIELALLRDPININDLNSNERKYIIERYQEGISVQEIEKLVRKAQKAGDVHGERTSREIELELDKFDKFYGR